MNKIKKWIRNHKEETQDLLCLVVFTVAAAVFVFGKEFAIVLFGILGASATVIAAVTE